MITHRGTSEKIYRYCRSRYISQWLTVYDCEAREKSLPRIPPAGTYGNYTTTTFWACTGLKLVLHKDDVLARQTFGVSIDVQKTIYEAS